MDAAAVQARYTGVAIILHWLIAIAIVGQIASGLWMVAADPQNPVVFTVYQAHKTAGLIVLALTLARIVWRLGHRPPPLPAGMPAIERLAASASHIAFYVLMIAVPLSGWAMVSLSPTGVPTFFLLIEALPFAHLPIAAETELSLRHEGESIAKTIHGVLAYGTAGLLVVHVVAALKHQLIARDGLIGRMVPGSRRPMTGSRPGVALAGFALAALFLIAGLAAGQMGAAPSPGGTPVSGSASQAGSPGDDSGWVIDSGASSLGFRISFSGNEVSGSFASWSATIEFDPGRLDTARAGIVIDMVSVSLDDAYLSSQSGGADGFDTASHPQAHFEAESFRHVQGNRYEAEGALILRGAAVPVSVSFTFDEVDGTARVAGSALLNRLDFGIGAASAPDEAWLKHSVEVVFEIVAVREDPDPSEAGSR